MLNRLQGNKKKSGRKLAIKLVKSGLIKDFRVDGEARIKSGERVKKEWRKSGERVKN